jgi:hypothetical protein
MHDWDTRANIGCILRQSYKHDPSGCMENLFALSDLYPREELIMKYGGFFITGTLIRLVLQFLGLI